jgi:hypothetical protein
VLPPHWQHGYFVSRAFDETLMLGLRSAAAAAVNVTRSFSLSEGFGGVKWPKRFFKGPMWDFDDDQSSILPILPRLVRSPHK